MKAFRRGPWRPQQGLYWEGIYSASMPTLKATTRPFRPEADLPICPEPPAPRWLWG